MAGREELQEIQAALTEFEEAIVHREHKRLLESSVARQQDVDHVRQKVVDLIVRLVTAERMKAER